MTSSACHFIHSHGFQARADLTGLAAATLRFFGANERWLSAGGSSVGIARRSGTGVLLTRTTGFQRRASVRNIDISDTASDRLLHQFRFTRNAAMDATGASGRVEALAPLWRTSFEAAVKHCKQNAA